MKRLLPWVSYLIFIPLMLFVTVACGSLSLLVSLWDKSGRQQHAIAHIWAKLMLVIALSPMKVVNPQNLHLGRAAVFASNHLSYMDTPALFGALPFQFRILANHYLFKIPFIGWHLTRSGQVPIDQSSMRSMVAGLMRGVSTLKSGMPLLIFPDGGRSSDGHIRQFLQGAAFMAIKAQVPLVPLALVGTYELLPMHTYHLAPRPLLLIACDPINTTGMVTKDAEALTQRLMDAIATEYYRHSQLVQPASVPENQAKIPSSQL
ncbi:lysophospholipid acyltransferase family protein [Terriglobus sp. RCC_193]|uniref:lysophospholipid acyltransferase family protein n=1 Tax=Terriglobus sp. RCC_193 TaxID=3239218 RepID=UPI0035243F7E